MKMKLKVPFAYHDLHILWHIEVHCLQVTHRISTLLLNITSNLHILTHYFMKALPFCARAQSIKQKKKKNDTNMMNDNKLLSADFIH